MLKKYIIRSTGSSAGNGVVYSVAKLDELAYKRYKDIMKDLTDQQIQDYLYRYVNGTASDSLYKVKKFCDELRTADEY